MLAAEWTSKREQRRVQEPLVDATAMEDVLATLKLSELLAIILAVAHTDRAAPFRAHVRWLLRQDAAEQIQVMRGAHRLLDRARWACPGDVWHTC